MSQNKIDILKKQISQVPQKPGVYLWKDSQGKVIYVGKAKNLRSRMRQYVNFQDDRIKIPLLVDTIESFEYVIVQNEPESLILEKQLIDKHKPYFNADFKDDKSYPFIALTTGDYFPAIKYTREKHISSSTYFGPYTDSHAAREMVDVIRRVVPICACGCAEWRSINREINKYKKQIDKAKGEEELANAKKELSKFLKSLKKRKPCFDCHVGLGPGSCCGKIDREDYLSQVRIVRRFLSGQQNEFLFDLQNSMQNAANSLDFEKAARYKSRIDIINANAEKQHIVSSQNLDGDVIGLFCEDEISGVYVLVVREGRIVNGCEFILDKGKNHPVDELTANFISKYYTSSTQIPRQIIVENLPTEHKLIEKWLTEFLNSSHGAKVSIKVPTKGNKQQLLNMAKQNAKHALLRYKVKNNYDDKRTNTALLQLESALSMINSPMRIECFDISTIHGSHTVASMIVFNAGKADKSAYRRFKIKTELDEANDFLCMQEVLSRRYCKNRLEDKRFGQRPDLILLDGGKPQLTAAIKIFDEIGFDWQGTGTALAGLAKSDEELIVPYGEGEYDTIHLPDGSASLYLIKQVRDEAHRFAITYHRQLRAKAMTKSVLDTVPGIGPARKKAVLNYFKSLKQLRAASLEQIVESKTLPLDIARELYLVLHQDD